MPKNASFISIYWAESKGKNSNQKLLNENKKFQNKTFLNRSEVGIRIFKLHRIFLCEYHTIKSLQLPGSIRNSILGHIWNIFGHIGS